MFAIVEAYRAGLFNRKNWLPNIGAGLIVGVVALPLAMAFAIASGAQPEQGLYTAIVAAFFVGVFGGSRVQIAGPTGAFIVILAGITAQYGIVGLQIASCMAGFLLLLMGFMKLGTVIKFIPDPVIVGFTSGIGFIIFVGEWKDFFGLPLHVPLGTPFYKTVWILIRALPHLHLATTGLACLSLFLVLITPKIVKHIPGPLVALVIVSALQALFHFENVATLGSAFGGIPQHLPSFQWPHITFDKISDLMVPAFTIALLGAIESLLSATAADGMGGTRHNSNQELMGQGLANIIAPLWGGFAATGAIARTATNIRNGGNSPISAIVHSLFLLLVLISLAPLAANIPLCTLAAILFIVSYNMSDVSHFIFVIRRAPHYDVLTLIVTFLLTIFTNLVIAVNVGVILAILFFVRRMTQSVTLEQHSLEQLSTDIPSERRSAIPKDTLIYSIQGPFFFGVAEKIEHALMTTHTAPKIVILRLKDVPFMDMTGLTTLDELIEKYNENNIAVYLCEANPKVAHKITKLGILQQVCQQRIFSTINEALTASHPK